MTDFAPQPLQESNTTTAGAQVLPLVTALAGGGYVVVWMSTPDQQVGSGETVQAQLYDASGQRVGGESQVFGDTTHAFIPAGVAGLPDGSFVVSASTSDSSGGTPTTAAVAQHLDASGQRLGGETVVATAQGTAAVSSTGVYAASDGGWYVGLTQTDSQDATGSWTAMQRYDAAGTAVGGETAQVAGAPAFSSAASLSNGDVVTASELVNGFQLAIQWEQVDPSGAVVSTQTISTTAGSYKGAPTSHLVVAGLAGGGSVLVWHPAAFAPDLLKAQLFDAAGHATGDAISLSAPQAYGYDSQVDGLADGGFLLTWLVRGTTVSSDAEVVGQRYDAQGHALGNQMQLSPEMPLNTTQRTQHQWDVTATSDGGFVVSVDIGGGATGDDICQQKWTPATAGSFQGTSGDDHLVGTTGNDRLDGLGGNDSLDGLVGIDTAVIDTSVANVQSYSIANGVVTLATNLGTDTLTNIERVQFGDALFALDTNRGDHVWEAAALFHAGFGVLPGMEDLSHWTAQADQSSSMGDLAQKMIDSYAPGISSSDLVTYLYQQFTQQAPTADVVQSYVDQIGPGKTFATQGDLLAWAANLQVNTDGVASIVGTVQQLDPHAF
jgi:hypothetical protein